MFHIALFEPEIPPNTGNIIRLCANTGAQLHLIRPLGFTLDDHRLRRAGLDYHEWANVQLYENLPSFFATINLKAIENNTVPPRLFACTTKGTTCYSHVGYQANDILLFGPETRGLPPSVLSLLPEKNKIRIPMLPESRSLNLSNAVAVILYEAWRQNVFDY
jgi:tRNA (cytidine/uridine-2'-O-)-methyltransferase